jgi:hypothetical protein
LVDPENPSEPSEDPKALARSLIREGVDPEEVSQRTGLTLPQVNGLKGVLRKTLKRAQGESGESVDKPSRPDVNVGIPTESDFLRQILQDVKFSKIDAVVSLVDSYGYNVQGLYAALKDVSASLSIVRYVVKRWAAYRSENVPGWILREIEGTSMVRPHVASNDGDSQALTKAELVTLFDEKLKQQRDEEWRGWVNKKLENNDGGGQLTKLEAQFEEMMKEFRDKQLEDIKSEVESLRRNASAPDSLTQVVKSVENLLTEGLQHPGPIRSYLVPDGISIGKKSDAPALLHTQVGTGSGTVVSELSKHGLVTVLRKGP